MIDLVYVATSNKLNETISSIRSVLHHPPFPDRITVITDKPESFSLRRCPIPIKLEKLVPILERFPLGNKIRACESDADTIIYVDNDTFMNRSILDLVRKSSSEWEIRGRVASIFVNGKIQHDAWSEFFTSRGLTPVPMWNTGVLCIKSRLKKEVRLSWEKWFVELSKIKYSHICEPFAMDQLALSLAVAELECSHSDLSPDDHSFEWEHEHPFKSTVHHTSSRFYSRCSIRQRLARLPGFRSLAANLLVEIENLARKIVRLAR